MHAGSGRRRRLGRLRPDRQAENLAWTGAAGTTGTEATPIEGKVERIRLRALRIDLTRSWLDFQLLAIAGWEIDGMPGGFFSSGTQADNSGIFPLLPIALVIASDIIIKGDWSRSDRALMRQHAAEDHALASAPFRSMPSSRRAAALRIRQAHVIGAIRALVPYAPQATDIDPGLVLVKNDGGFVARFTATGGRQGPLPRGAGICDSLLGDYDAIGAEMGYDAGRISIIRELRDMLDKGAAAVAAAEDWTAMAEVTSGTLRRLLLRFGQLMEGIACVQVFHVIDTFYLYRLLVRYRVEATTSRGMTSGWLSVAG